MIATGDMGMQLHKVNLQADCDVPEFMAAAEPMFSQTIRDGVGAALSDNSPPSTYQDWLDDVGRVIRAIDDGESPPPSGR